MNHLNLTPEQRYMNYVYLTSEDRINIYLVALLREIKSHIEFLIDTGLPHDYERAPLMSSLMYEYCEILDNAKTLSEPPILNEKT